MSTAKILVVDDAPDVLAVAQQALRRRSYDVITASSGREALEMLNVDSGVDLVLAEVLMPGMAGTELIDIVNRRHPSAATMLMAGYTGDEVIDPGIALLRKPFTAGELVSEVGRVLAEGGQPPSESRQLQRRQTAPAGKSRAAEQA